MSGRGSHWGSFGKGFADSFIAALRAAKQAEYYDARSEYYRNKGKPTDPTAAYAGPGGAEYDSHGGLIDEGDGSTGTAGASGASGGGSGDKTDFERVRQAMTAQESGGNYGIVNSIGATGRYQVMPQNIGPWTKQYLGKEMTQQEFRNDPAAQDKVFEGRMGDYYKQFGNWRDAVSAWHSGRPYDQAVRDGAHDSNMSTATYVSNVMGKAGVGDTPAVAKAPTPPERTGYAQVTPSSPNANRDFRDIPNPLECN